MKRLLMVAGGLAVAIIGAGFWWMSQGGDDATAASVAMPELSATAAAGQQAFEEI